MAVEFDIKAPRTSEYGFLPEELDVDPNLNGRHDLPDLQPLIQSILTHGQLQPVTIRKSAGKPVLVAGFTRWRAVAEINSKRLTPKPLRLRCSYTQLSEREAFLANIEENRVRNATTPMDDAYNINRLMRVYQMTVEDCAEAYRASIAWVKSRLELLELCPEAEQAVREGRLGGTAARQVAKLSKEHQQRIAASPGKIAAADIRRESPAPAPKPTKAPDLPRLVSALFDDMTAEEIAEIASGDSPYASVNRAALLALYHAMKEAQ